MTSSHHCLSHNFSNLPSTPSTSFFFFNSLSSFLESFANWNARLFVFDLRFKLIASSPPSSDSKASSLAQKTFDATFFMSESRLDVFFLQMKKGLLFLPHEFLPFAAHDAMFEVSSLIVELVLHTEVFGGARVLLLITTIELKPTPRAFSASFTRSSLTFWRCFSSPLSG